MNANKHEFPVKLTPREELDLANSSKLRDTSEVRRQAVTFSLAMIAALWATSQGEMIVNLGAAKSAFTGAFVTIALNIVGLASRARHFSVCVRDSTKRLGWRGTCWGMVAEYSWGAVVASLLVTSVFFVIALTHAG